MKIIPKIFLFCLPAVLMFICFSNYIFASVMSSNGYAIQSDDITPSGGKWTSTNYIFKDTLGEFSVGPSTSTSYAMKAGYQPMQETYLTVSAPSNVSMTPSIPGLSGGTATGTDTTTVITDDSAGFTMGVNASTSPAMVRVSDITHYFDNYTTDGTPTYGWTVTSAAKFGFTVVPGSLGGLVLAFQDTGVLRPSKGGTIGGTCGGGGGSGNCYSGFITTPVNVVSTTSRTSVSGEQETVNLEAQSDNTVLESGTYTATITTTISAN